MRAAHDRSVLGLVWLLAITALAALTSCGISPDAAPRPLPESVQSPGATPEPAPSVSESPLNELPLWFVREGAIAQVARDREGFPDPQERLDLLAIGPTEEETAAGLRTAVVSVVTGEPLTTTALDVGLIVEVEPGEIAVILDPTFGDLPPDEQQLVLAQVVSTLAVDGTSAIVFVDPEGNRLGVPLPDGRLAEGSVTPEDYESLRE